MTLGLAVACFVFLDALDVQAAPIHPDIRQLIAQPQDASSPYMPARAGWDGSEMPPRYSADINPALDPVAVRRANQAALVSAATPDIRAVLALIAIIFLLRMFKTQEQKAAERRNLAHPRHETEDRLAA